MNFSRTPRALLQTARARYASTAAESTSSTSVNTPPPPFTSSANVSPSTPSATSATSQTASSSSPSPSPSTSASSSVPTSSSANAELSPVFGRHVPIEPTHGVHVATLHLRSYTDSVPDLQFFTSFALRAARALGLPTSGAVALPTRTSLFTVPRSPFAHKKSQQNFWRKEHKRAIKVWDGDERVVEAWLAYLRKEALGGVGMKAQVFTYRPIGWGEQLGNANALEGEEEEALRAQEEELLGMAAGGDSAEVERIAKDLVQELEHGIEEAEEGQAAPKERQELKEVEQVEGESKKNDK